ncbi:MAG: O-methyltransferase [Paludibacteraceae bacterium]|nr:O-methyltransferase [Paludibacteraceae bacterium]
MGIELLDYIESHISAEPEALRRITHDTHVNVLNPHMLSGHLQGRFLAMMSRMIGPKRILELGTFTGYSALCMAEGLAEDGVLVTIEHNDELEETIRANLSLSPLGRKVELRIGDAKQVVPTLEGAFDMVFIDADKREYCEYLDLVFDKVRAGGWIIADNTLWDGHVADAKYDRDKQTLGLRAFNDKVHDDNRLENVILPIRDGLSIIRKK